VSQSRNEVAQRCVEAAVACWNRYAEKPIERDCTRYTSYDAIEDALDGVLPRELCVGRRPLRVFQGEDEG